MGWRNEAQFGTLVPLIGDWRFGSGHVRESDADVLRGVLGDMEVDRLWHLSE